MAGGAPITNSGSTSSSEGKNYSKPLIVVTTLFFMWGFITCMNDILIPKFKEEFNLSNVQANLVQSAFFGAYFFVSLFYYLFSRAKFDPIAKFGYKKAIIAGLLIAAAGCFLFVPAASTESFEFFLFALFVLATGITVLQMGANPYVTLLGKPENAESRLNLTQAFNALGTTVAPVVGGILIFGATSLAVVKGPYIGLGFILLALVVLIGLSPLPKIVSGDSSSEEKGVGAVKFPHLVLGVICIFMYVGGEVSIGSNIIQYLKDAIGVAESHADALLAVYWGGAMIGRFYGAIFLSKGAIDAKKSIQIGLLVIFSFVLGVFLINKKYIIDSINGQGSFTHKFKTEQVTGIKAFAALDTVTTEKTELDLVINKASFIDDQKLVAAEGDSVKFKFYGEKLDECGISFEEKVAWKGFGSLEINGAFIFSAMALLNVLLFLLGRSGAGKTLGLFALAVIVLLGVSVFGSGSIGMWSVLCIGLFNSIMFPTIFSLAVKGLGIDTSQGSSLLVMAIVGGGIIPLFQGAVADVSTVQLGFLIPILCYAYIAFYGFIGSKPKGPGIDRK